MKDGDRLAWRRKREKKCTERKRKILEGKCKLVKEGDENWKE